MIRIPPMTQEQFQTLMGLIDLGVKAGGVQVVRQASSVLAVLEKNEVLEDKPAPANKGQKGPPVKSHDRHG